MTRVEQSEQIRRDYSRTGCWSEPCRSVMGYIGGCAAGVGVGAAAGQASSGESSGAEDMRGDQPARLRTQSTEHRGSVAS
jgi:hypothetical protein